MIICGSSLRRRALNFHFKLRDAHLLLQTTSHKNVTASDRPHRPLLDLAVITCSGAGRLGRHCYTLEVAFRGTFACDFPHPQPLFPPPTLASKWLQRTSCLPRCCWCSVAARRENDSPFIKQEEELTTVSRSYFWRGVCANNKELSDSNRSALRWHPNK